MAQIYKIFVNETPVVIREGNPSDVNGNEEARKPVYFFTEKEKISQALKLVETGSYYRSLTIIGEDAKEIKRGMFQDYRTIKAAGGLVFNEKNEILLIYRHGMWDLPKGKLESGESIRVAALREIQEETGLKQIELVRKLRTTYHTYVTFDKQKVLKKTYWWLMKGSLADVLRPQIEEGIEAAVWVPTSSIEQKLSSTYGNIRDVIDSGLVAMHLL